MTDAAGPATGPGTPGLRGRYARVLLKISGEALLGERTYGVDPAVCTFIARQVGQLREAGVQVAIVYPDGRAWSFESGLANVGAASVYALVPLPPVNVLSSLAGVPLPAVKGTMNFKGF